MTTNLAENIRKIRKGKGLTQEQLAEALGVTTGAVYKWEAEKSMPEIGMLMEIADFFDMSVDRLLGYEVRINDKENMLKRINQLVYQRNLREVEKEAEKVLCKYPNNFKVVYTCASAYHRSGVDFKNEKCFRKAIELYQRAILLLEENTDSEISLLSIHKNMAGIYMELGELEIALNLLKSNNPCGLHNAAIGHLLAYSNKEVSEAMKYLSIALFDSIATQSLTVAGFLKVYIDRADYQSVIDIIDWFLDSVRGLRVDGKQNFWMRSESLLMAIQGDMFCRLKNEKKAFEVLSKAKTLAIQFDENPYWGLENFRFIELNEAWDIHDSIGETAMMAIEKYISKEADHDTKVIWEKI